MRNTELIGKTVKAYRGLGRNADSLLFTWLQNGETVGAIFDLDADCCSKSWIEHVEGVAALAGEITAVWDSEGYFASHETLGDGVPSAVRDDICAYDCIRRWVVKITTAAGHLDIECRNSSNGYYSGCLEQEGPFLDAETIAAMSLNGWAELKDC